MSDVTRLVLVRHGESQAAVSRVVGGEIGCTGLSELGRRQAEALRDRIRRTGELAADVLLASSLPRAVETAEILAPALGAHDVVRDCDLCELHPGECDGLGWDEYAEQYGVDMGADPYAPMSPGGESLAEFNVRVGRALAGLTARHEGSIVVACHGGVIIGSLVNFLQLPAQRPLAADVNVDNCSITEWHQASDGRWRLVRFNDVAHLLGVG